MTDSAPQPEALARSPVNLSGHMPPLDGLRGAALLMVLVYHAALGTFRPAGGGYHKLDYYYYHLASIGWSGVDLFFVLSGFLITGILIDARSRQGYFRNFYMRRVLRIFPLYYLLLLVVFLLMPLVLGLLHDPPPQLTENFQQPQDGSAWWFFAYLSNFYAAQVGHLGGALGETNRALAVLWSLAIEEQFYMVWPLVVFLVPRQALGWVCVAVIFTAMGCRAFLLLAEPGWFVHTPVAVYVLPFCRMDGLAMGALVAVLGRRAGGIEALRRWGWAMVLIGVTWMSVCLVVSMKTDFGLTSSRARPMQLAGYSVLALGFAGGLILLLNTRRGPVRWLFTSRPLTQVGQVSYGMYLFHLPIIYALSAYGFRPDAMPKVAGMWLPAQLVFTLVVLAVTYLVAFLSWHAFEKHLVVLKRYFVPRSPNTMRGAPPVAEQTKA